MRKYHKLLFLLAILLLCFTAFRFTQYYIIEGPAVQTISDFHGFWRTSQQLLHHEIAALYDTREPEEIVQKYPHDLNVRLWPLIYMPQSLFIIAPLAWFPHDVALALWSILPLILYYGVLFLLLKHSTLQAENARSRHLAYFVIAVAVLPFLKASLFSAQTGALLAVFFLAAIYYWDRRPVIAGLAFSLMIVKPQAAMLIPIALLVSGKWRPIIAAAVSSLVLAVAATLWLGVDIWAAYLNMTQWFTNFLLANLESCVLALGPYLALTSSGFPVGFALVVQGGVTLYMIATIIRIFRDKDAGRQDLRFGLLACGALLATPYSYCYDMPILAAAIVPLLVRIWQQGFGTAFENIALAAVITTPYAQPALRLPVGLVAVALLFAALKRRYRMGAKRPVI